MNYETLTMRQRDSICFIRINRPAADNAIDAKLVAEFSGVIDECRTKSTVVVIEGQADHFCTGADFSEVEKFAADGFDANVHTEALYDLWFALATGPFVSVAHVKGKTVAGGIGFVAACDITIADEKAVFSLPEMLFGLMPACVLPFLINRTSRQKAHLLTLLTQPVSAIEAKAFGLIDAVDANSDDVLRRYLLRLRMLRKTSIERYKRYRAQLDTHLESSRGLALEANKQVFSDSKNIELISHFRRTGQILREESES